MNLVPPFVLFRPRLAPTQPQASVLAWITLLACTVLPGLRGADAFDAAVAQFHARRFAEAQTAFAALPATDPRQAEIAYYLGALAVRRGTPAEALQHLERSVALDSGSARVYQALGDAYGLSAQKAGLLSKLGLAKKCLASYEKAVALAPDVISYRFSLLSYYSQAPALAGGGRDKAFAVAREIQKLDPIMGGLSIVNLHVSEKEWSQAFALIEELRQAHPGNNELNYQFGRLASLSGQQVEPGIAALQRFLDAPPAPEETSRIQARFRLGVLLEKRGDPEAAKQAYRQTLELNPNHRQAREALDRLK
ncbi:MAG: tetratricopeptide repeat protein [Opitutaceae bacterium]|nr:tetratricopeptide repeat protein [Opitutaceae bacterium]